MRGALTDATLPVVTRRTCVQLGLRSSFAMNAIEGSLGDDVSVWVIWKQIVDGISAASGRVYRSFRIHL